MKSWHKHTREPELFSLCRLPLPQRQENQRNQADYQRKEIFGVLPFPQPLTPATKGEGN